MTTTTVGIVVSEFIIIALLCFSLIRYYKSNLVSFDVTLAVYVSWVMGFACILLLPYDVANAFIYGKEYRYPLESVWRAIYWSTFLLAWLLLPIQLEYHNSGQFHFAGKFKDAIFRNILFGIFAAVIGFIYIVYTVSASHASPSKVIGFLMAMGNTYGVVLIILLMGNGLVGIPKRLMEMSDYEGELIRLYMSARSIENAFHEARYELEDCEEEVKKAGHIIEIAVMGGTFDKDLLNYVSILNTQVANFQFSSRSTTLKYAPNSDSLEAREKFRERSAFIELNSRLIRAQLQARACEIRWRNLITNVQRYESLLANDSTSTSDMRWCVMPLATTTSKISTMAPIVVNWNNQLQARLQACWLWIYDIWTYRCHRTCCRILSIICCAASMIILWSELMLATNWTSPIGYIIKSNSQSGSNSSAFIQLVAFFSLSYMSICTYWSLFRVNLGYAYSLQGPNQTTHSSLIFNAEYFSRLQFTLGYNFLLILNVNKTDNTAFSELMSNMELIPVFGSSFLVYVPIIMILVSLITLFNGFAKICRFFGIETEEISSSNVLSCKKVEVHDEDREQYNAGKSIVMSELKNLHPELDDNSRSSNNHTRTPIQNERPEARRTRHEIEMGRYHQPHDTTSSSKDHSSSTIKNSLFSGRRGRDQVKYMKQNLSEHDNTEDLDDNDGDEDIETFTFKSSANHDVSSSSSNEASSSTSSFSNWKIFGGSRGQDLLPSSTSSSSSSGARKGSTYDSAQLASYDHQSSSSLSKRPTAYSDTGYVDNPIISKASTAKPSAATINFRIDDDEEDEVGGRYSGY